MFKVNFPQGNLFTGIYLSVPFRDGEGVTDNAYLADRFRAKGMAVEKQKAQRGKKTEAPPSQDDTVNGKELAPPQDDDLQPDPAPETDPAD